MQIYSLTTVELSKAGYATPTILIHKPRKGKYHPTWNGINKTWKKWINLGYTVKTWETKYGTREVIIEHLKFSRLSNSEISEYIAILNQ